MVLTRLLLALLCDPRAGASRVNPADLVVSWAEPARTSGQTKHPRADDGSLLDLWLAVICWRWVDIEVLAIG